MIAGICVCPGRSARTCCPPGAPRCWCHTAPNIGLDVILVVSADPDDPTTPPRRHGADVDQPLAHPLKEARLIPMRSRSLVHLAVVALVAGTFLACAIDPNPPNPHGGAGGDPPGLGAGSGGGGSDPPDGGTDAEAGP